MRVEVDIDAWEVLDDIDTADLEAEVAKRRRADRKVMDQVDRLMESIDHDCLETALWHWEANRAEDALFFLERALGRRFAGLSELAARRAA